MVLGKLYRYVQNLDQHFTPYARINSNWIKDLNVRLKTIKILEENIGSIILNIPCSNISSDMSPWASKRKEKVKKWEYIKLKKILHSKGNHQQNEKTSH